MERATAYGYRVEVIDEMRRSILPVKDLRTYRQLIAAAARAQARRRSHAQQQGRHHRALGGAQARTCRSIVHTIHGLAFTASTSRAVNAVYKMLERKAAPITHRIVCVADAMRDQSLAANIGRPEQYVTVYSGMETAPFLNPPVPRDEVRTTARIAATITSPSARSRGCFISRATTICSTSRRSLCADFPTCDSSGSATALLRAAIRAAHRRDEAARIDSSSPAWFRRRRSRSWSTRWTSSSIPRAAKDWPAHCRKASLAGCPVITYDIDGNREGLIDGETGFLLPPFDQGKAWRMHCER